MAGRYTTRALLEDEIDVGSQVLGAGACGQVHRCVHRKTGTQLAVKSFSKNSLCAEQREELRSEIETLLLADHPHVLRLERVFETEAKFHIVTECLEGEELFDRLLSRKKFSEPDAAVAIKQILLAVAHLHGLGVVHRDLKLENVVYERRDSDDLKLIDFGMATRWDGKTPMSVKCGSLQYVSPEVLAGSYGEKADLWSVGVMAYMLLCGCGPWLGDDQERMRMIQRGMPHYSPALFDPLSAGARELVKELLVADPSCRPSAAAALRLPWLNSSVVPSLPPPTGLATSLRAFASAAPLRQACLLVAARCLPQAACAPFRAQFLALDTDGLGRPSTEDLAQFLAEAGVCDVQEAKALATSADLDVDGSISYSEFLAAASAVNGERDEAVGRRAFDRFDVEVGGCAGESDLVRLLGKRGRDVGPLLGEYGGSLSCEELCAILRQPSEVAIRAGLETVKPGFADQRIVDLPSPVRKRVCPSPSPKASDRQGAKGECAKASVSQPQSEAGAVDILDKVLSSMTLAIQVSTVLAVLLTVQSSLSSPAAVTLSF